jgi:excisionase family DNA binding protein
LIKEGRPIAPDTANDKLLVTVDEAARRLSIGRSHIYEHLLRGNLRSVRIGRSRRIASSDLEAFIDQLLRDAAVTSQAIAVPVQNRHVKKLPDPPSRR